MENEIDVIVVPEVPKTIADQEVFVYVPDMDDRYYTQDEIHNLLAQKLDKVGGHVNGSLQVHGIVGIIDATDNQIARIDQSGNAYLRNVILNDGAGHNVSLQPLLETQEKSSAYVAPANGRGLAKVVIDTGTNGNTIARRLPDGRLKSSNPVANDDTANKGFVLDQIAANKGMQFYEVTYSGGKFRHGDTILNYAALVDKFEDPNWFLYLTYQNLVYIPSIDTNDALAFSVAWTLKKDLAAGEKYSQPYISRVIINSTEDIKTEQIGAQALSLMLTNFDEYADYVEEYGEQTARAFFSKYYPNATAVMDYVAEHGGGSNVPSFKLSSTQIIVPMDRKVHDTYTEHTITFSITNEQASYIEDNSKPVIKLQLSQHIPYVDGDYLYLQRNVIQTLNNQEVIQFTFNNARFNFDKALTEGRIPMTEIGDGAAIYAKSTKTLFISFVETSPKKVEDALNTSNINLENGSGDHSLVQKVIPSSTGDPNNYATGKEAVSLGRYSITKADRAMTINYDNKNYGKWSFVANKSNRVGSENVNQDMVQSNTVFGEGNIVEFGIEGLISGKSNINYEGDRFNLSGFENKNHTNLTRMSGWKNESLSEVKSVIPSGGGSTPPDTPPTEPGTPFDYTSVLGYNDISGNENKVFAMGARARGVAGICYSPFGSTEGFWTKAGYTVEKERRNGYIYYKPQGLGAKAFGAGTWAKEDYTVAGGEQTQALKKGSTTLGLMTVATNMWETVIGKFNAEYNDALFEIGNGSSNTARSNAFTVYNDGHAEVKEQGTTDKSVAQVKFVQDYVAEHSGGGAKRYKHTVISGGNKFEIVNFSSTVLTPANMSNELRKGYCYIRYFYTSESHDPKASDCIVVYQDGYFEGSWQDNAISLFYFRKESTGVAAINFVYLLNPTISTISDTVTEV